MIPFRRATPAPPVVRQHRIVTTQEHGATRHFCLDCGASRAGIQPPMPPCRGES